MEAGPDVVRLNDLLTTDDFPFSKGAFSEGGYSDWSNQDYINCGGWALKLIQPEGFLEPVVPLTTTHIKRLHILGLSPHVSRYTIPMRFGGWEAFKQEIGSPEGYVRGRFDDWTHEQFVNEARLIYWHTKRKPGNADFDNAARLAWPRIAPDSWVIRERCGGVEKLNEFIGFPNTRIWDRDDYLEWGRKVLSANPDVSLSLDRKLIDIISARQRGPSRNAIERAFGSRKNFADEVEKYLLMYTEDKAWKEKTKNKVLEDFSTQPPGLQADFMQTHPDIRASFAGMYFVINKLVGQKRIAEKVARRFIKSQGGTDYLNIIRATYPDVALADIETTALEMGIFDVVWPVPEEDLSDLVV